MVVRRLRASNHVLAPRARPRAYPAADDICQAYQAYQVLAYLSNLVSREPLNLIKNKSMFSDVYYVPPYFLSQWYPFENLEVTDARTNNKFRERTLQELPDRYPIIIISS